MQCLRGVITLTYYFSKLVYMGDFFEQNNNFSYHAEIKNYAKSTSSTQQNLVLLLVKKGDFSKEQGACCISTSFFDSSSFQF